MSVTDPMIVLQAGINRFFDEHYYRWPRATVEHVLSPASADDPVVTRSLLKWSQLGYIRFVGSDECYFEVLRPVIGY
jgi:hypothetical protein